MAFSIPVGFSRCEGGSTLDLSVVMAGLDPAIHDFLTAGTKDVDARLKAGHDELSERRCSS